MARFDSVNDPSEMPRIVQVTGQQFNPDARRTKGSELLTNTLVSELYDEQAVQEMTGGPKNSALITGQTAGR